MKNFLDYNNTGFQALEEKHVKEGLAEKLGRQVSHLTPISVGHVNRSYIVQTAGEIYFCKISPLWYKKSLAREKWCLERLRDTDIRVPHVIGLVEDENTHVPGHEILILEYIPGRLLSDLPALSNPLLMEIKRIYDRIHSFGVERFGWLGTDFRGGKDTWAEFLTDIENLDSCRSISGHWSEMIDHMLAGLAECGFDSAGCLLYGDFNLDNFIMSPTGGLYALDFQNCFSGDPLYDYPLIIDKYPSFRELLGINGEQDTRLFKLYTLRYILTRLSYFKEKNDVSLIAFYKEKFESVYHGLIKS